jgi:PAS domain S-box-containing protein
VSRIQVKRRTIPVIAEVAVLVAIYFAAAKLGLSLAFLNGSVSPVWPPTGVAIAAMLLLGYRATPGVAIAAFLANYLLTPVGAITAAGIAAGNTLEAMTALFLLRIFVKEDFFNRAIDLLKFVVIAAIASPAVAATIGNIGLRLAGLESWSNFGPLWLTWWSGDGVGAMIVTPLILTWIKRSGKKFRWSRLLEATALVLSLTIVELWIFTNFFGHQSSRYPLGHFAIPILIWAAFRFGPRGVATCIALISVIAVWGTTHHIGPFAEANTNEALLLLQAFVADLAITSFVLAAIVTESRRARRAVSFAASIVDSTDDVVIGKDLDGIILSWNKAAERIYGYAAEEVIGRHISLLLPPGRPDDIKLIMAKLKRGERILNYETVRLTKDGREIDVSLTISPIKSPSGQTTRASTIARDITERKRAEQALLETREWLRMTMEGGRIGTWTRDLDEHNRVKWSPELERIFGLEPGEFPQTEEAFFGFVHPEDRESLGAAVWGAIENRTDYEIEFRYRNKNGNTGWMLGRGRAFYDADGKPFRLAGLGLDITERKRNEEALIKNQEALRFAHKVARGGPWQWDLATNEVEWSEEYYELLRLSPEKVRATQREWERRIHPEDVETVRQETENAIAERRDIDVEFRIKRADGEWRWFHRTGRCTYSDEEKPLSLIGITFDITERKQAEQELERLLRSEQAARVEAEAANRTKDEFLATVSHELRTPLNAIVGWTSMLRSGRLDPDRIAHAIEIIDRNAKAQAQLVDDILEVSRIVSGKVRLDARSVELAQIIEAAIDSVRPAADARKIQITTVFDRAVGPVVGDADRLQQIVWNLLSNAVKFTPADGRVEVQLRSVDSQVEITVSDTGEGISPEFLPHVFDRFRQADGTITRQHKGLGLGLAIVRHLAELHGGTVSAESAGIGKGAKFSVSFPLLTGTAESESVKTRSSAGQQLRPHTLDGMRILVVDDEADARELVSVILSRVGAEVRAAASAHEGLAILSEWRPDLLISDLEMPGEDGYSLIRRVRQLNPEKGGGTLAVALTAHARLQDRERTLKAGFQLHIAKPVEPAELMLAITSLTGNNHNTT